MTPERSRRCERLVGLLGIALVLAGCTDRAAEPRPATLHGVVVLSFDALRADFLGAYGCPSRTSPALDEFADRTRVFEDAYSAAPKTPTSFASMFTGLPANHALKGWRLASATTVARLFSQAGYRTAAFTNNPQIRAARKFDAGFRDYVVRQRRVSDEKVLADALAWLRRHREERFFLWVHLLDPHAPWLRRAEAEHLYDSDYRGPFEREFPALFAIANPVELARARSLYAGEVFAADHLFAKLDAKIRALGLEDRVALIVTSDHGEELMDHGRLQHGQLTEENLHVPLLLHLPGVEPRRIATPVSTLDLAPTLLDAAGIAPPPVFTGRSLLASGAAQRDILALAVTESDRPAASIRRGDDKLILRCFGPERFSLYDLAADPHERRNLAADQPDQAAELEDALWNALGVRHCSDLPLVAPQDASRETQGLSEQDLRALKELGYLQDETPDR